MCLASLIHVSCITHTCVLHHSYMCVASLIHMCCITHTCVLHHSFICVKTHSRVYHDAFICVSWPIHSLMRGWGNEGYPRVISLLFAITSNFINHPYECQGNRMPQALCVPWLIRTCAVTHSYVCIAHSYVCHDSVDQGLRQSGITKGYLSSRLEPTQQVTTLFLFVGVGGVVCQGVWVSMGNG